MKIKYVNYEYTNDRGIKCMSKTEKVVLDSDEKWIFKTEHPWKVFLNTTKKEYAIIHHKNILETKSAEFVDNNFGVVSEWVLEHLEKYLVKLLKDEFEENPPTSVERKNLESVAQWNLDKFEEHIYYINKGDIL